MIGDGYMCVCGHESQGDNKHASRMLAFATDLIEAVAELRASPTALETAFDLQARATGLALSRTALARCVISIRP